MIKANFHTYNGYVTDSLYQWDINQVLSVSGLNLAVAPEVHFSNANMDKAIVRQATLKDNIVSVSIPNSILQQPLTINAHIGVYEGDTFNVIELVSIPVIAKSKPIDYKIENTDGEIYSFEALKNSIANMVKTSDFNRDKATINARIDTIIANNNDTNGNSELVDIRVGADGKTYKTAGEAIRTQLSDIIEGKTEEFNYTISESSTPVYNIAIKKGIRYKISLNFGNNVNNLDFGYTTDEGKDIILIDNAIPGKVYEFTPEHNGVHFRFWTYLNTSSETVVTGSIAKVGINERESSVENNIDTINSSLYGYKGHIYKDSMSVAMGYTLEPIYKITPGRKFYIVFNSFNYDVISKMNIYYNYSGGNVIFHDSITPVIDKLYECYTDAENSTLHFYFTPNGTGGVIDFNISIYEEDAIGEILKNHAVDISTLQESDTLTNERINEVFDNVGLPLYSKYSHTMTVTSPKDIEYPLINGKKYMLNVESYTGEYLSDIQIYLLNSMSDYKTVTGGVKVGDTIFFDGDSNYKYVRVYVMVSQNETEKAVLTVKLAEYNEESLNTRVEDLEKEVFKEVDKPNVLILGDSYSQIGYWVNQLKTLVNLGNIVNLGVSSASLKDKYLDRETYPYNDRPVSNDNRGGNVNTFGSQVEKLKRLMLGEDLDDGESKIYENVEDYPKIILIEGGTNDPIDASTDDYFSQIFTVQSGYIARKSGDGLTNGYIKVPTPYENTNRTTFGGAMRYLYGTLHEIFPDALIFFITPCGLTYMSGGNHDYLKKSEQIKYSASLLGIPVIDWSINGRLSVCDNIISGSGTEDDPYIYDLAGEYSLDALHPNNDGAYFLAMEVAKVLQSYNLVKYID